MYNELLKQSFLDTLSKPKNYQVFFNSIGKYEEEIGKDLSEMTRAEIAEGLGHMDYLLYNVVENFISMTRQYLLWYAEGHPGTVGLEVTNLNYKDVDLSENFRRKLITDPGEIVSEFSDYKPSDGHYIVPAMMLAFYGYNLTELCSLRREDVVCTGDTVIIILNGKASRIESPSLCKAVSEYMNWDGTKVKTKSSVYSMIPDRNGMFIYNRIRDDDYEEHELMDANKMTARFYQIKKRVAGGHEFRYDIGECRISGQYFRVCQYYNQYGKWPDKDKTNELAGTKRRSEFEAARIVYGAKLYKKVFNI